MSKASLGKKVVSLLAISVAIAGIVLSAFGTYRLRGLLIEQKLDASGQIASALASTALSDILNNDFIGLQDGADQVLERDSKQEITFVGIYDTRNEPLVRSSHTAEKQAPEESEDIKKVSVPVVHENRVFGRVDLYVSLSRTEGEVLQTVISLGGILLLVVTITAAAMAWVAFSLIVRPIQRLGGSARQISQGNLDMRIAVRSHDELGELSKDFNRMAENLKAREDELRAAYKKLKRNYEALRDAYRQLRELDQMKSNFIAVVSHELRTPLALIKGYVETMEAGNLGPVNSEQSEKLAVVIDSVDRLSEIVNKSLDFSLMEQGRVVLDSERLQLSEVLSQVVDEFSLEVTKRQLSLEQSVPGDLPLMEGDKVRLHQVFHNLVANALEFTPPGGIIGIRARHDLDKKENIVEISDTGLGIPETEIEYLFSPFYQVDSPIIRKHPGVGLGLAIAKGIVEEHHGTISVASKLGKGTTFTMSFPTLNGKTGHTDAKEE